MTAQDINRFPLTFKLLRTFFRNVSINPRVEFNGVPCWLWVGATYKGGYGTFGYNNQRFRAHRLSFEMFVHIIEPSNYHTDHLCRRRNCVNPVHLEAVSPRVNTLRSNAASAINARKTHCKRGHEFTPENTYVFKGKSGYGRACRECKRMYDRSPEVKAQRKIKRPWATPYQRMRRILYMREYNKHHYGHSKVTNS